MNNDGAPPVVWCEKYRPSTIEECILPVRIKKPFLRFVENGDFPNILLSGGAGVGKTTVALALCAELKCDTIVINASDERNLDVVRGRIKEFASQTSIMGNRKAIVLDESDGLSTLAQAALRAAMEEFSDVKFILTCNYVHKLIAPIRSRASTISFDIKKNERTEVAIKFLKRLFEILEKENVTYDKKVVGEVLKKYYPDNRRILNELQGYSSGEGGTIDTGMLSNLDKSNISELVASCKDKDVGKARKWVVDNINSDSADIFRDIYDTFYNEVSPECVPELITQLAEYQYKANFVADQEINMMAFIMTIIGNIDFK